MSRNEVANEVVAFVLIENVVKSHPRLLGEITSLPTCLVFTLRFFYIEHYIEKEAAKEAPD